MMRKIYSYLSSVRLAMMLLIAILACCVVGVTIYRGAEAGNRIFSTLWFNGLLVLLVVNVACCFFPRMWGRKLTFVSVGMILFHLSFVAMLGGIVYNSFFYFRGVIRLTEGETLPSGDPQSYDILEKGRYFDFSRLRGETSLIRMHKGYKVEGEDKVVAYEIAVGETGKKKQGVIYTTQSFDDNGFSYFRDKEGYSVLVILSDRQGREIYGAHVPLQSLRQNDGTYLYITGTADGPESLPFPQDPLKPLFNLQVAYRPDPSKERAGDAYFWVLPLAQGHEGKVPPASHVEGASKQDDAVGGLSHERIADAREGEVLAEGKAAVGETFRADDYMLSVREIRYWVGMTVRYEPGKPIVLTSLWVGLTGMVITFVGRIRKRRSERRAI